MALHQLSLQAARQTRGHYTTSTGLRQYSFGIGGEPASRLEDCVARIKDLRQQREALLKRKVELQKKVRAGASVLPIPTRLLDEYVRQISDAATTGKIGYKREFLGEISNEVRVKGNAVRLTYKGPMTVRTPPSEGINPRTGEFFTLYQMVEPMGVEPTASRVRF